MKRRLEAGALLAALLAGQGMAGQGVAGQGMAQTGTTVPTASPTAGPAAAQARSITLYSGRAKASVDPLIQRFQAQTGVRVNVVYDSDAALAARIASEAGQPGADLFWANGLQTLNTVQGRFQALPPSLASSVLAEYLPVSRRWLPTDARYRVLAYSSDRVQPGSLPQSLWDLPADTALRGRFGWTVSDPTFAELVASMIGQRGEAATRAWLLGVRALEPRDFGGENRGMLDAINAGTLDAALTTHVTVQRVRRAGHHVEAAFFAPGDVGNLQDESGVGLLAAAPHRADALRLMRALVQPEAQAFLLSINFEYPVISGLPYPATLQPAADIRTRASTVSPDVVGQHLERARALLSELDLL